MSEWANILFFLHWIHIKLNKKVLSWPLQRRQSRRTQFKWFTESHTNKIYQFTLCSLNGGNGLWLINLFVKHTQKFKRPQAGRKLWPKRGWWWKARPNPWWVQGLCPLQDRHQHTGARLGSDPWVHTVRDTPGTLLGTWPPAVPRCRLPRPKHRHVPPTQGRGNQADAERRWSYWP